MANRSLICLLISAVCICCSKKPIAAFSPDKTEYISGETVVLTNQSKNADIYKWTLPGGDTETDKDLSFIIGADAGFDNFKFTLTAHSRKHLKNSSCSKNIAVVPQSRVSAPKQLTFYHCNLTTSSGVTTIRFSSDNDIFRDYPFSSYCERIYFQFKENQLTPGTYSLTGTLSQNTASIGLLTGPEDPHYGVYAQSLISTDGQLIVDEVNSHLHFVFNNVPTQYVGTVLTGEFFVPKF